MNILRSLYRVSVACMLLLVSREGAGQSKRDLQIPELLLGKSDVSAAARQPIEFKGVPLDAPVKADEYTVGPGDVLMLHVWSSAPVENQLTVTPEGFLLIPNVGTLDVRNSTLAQVRERATALTARKYPGAEISLTLMAPRKVSVQIAGQVMNEGMLEVYSVQRVDNLIEQANLLPSTQLTRKFYDQDKAQLRREASQRFIMVQHRDGTSQRVDLFKYLLTGAGRYNPYLREGDVVFVPPRRTQDNQIGIYGAVTRNGSVEFVPGDSLMDLVRYGLGLTLKALPEVATLTRLSVDGKVMDTVSVNVRAVADGRAPDNALRPGDRLVIPGERDPREGNAVLIEGEVLRPGAYPITRNTTTLSEVIRAAGGFTGDAYLQGATLLRSRVGDPELPQAIERERLLSARTSILMEDSTYYLMETELRLRGELVSVDFHGLFELGDSTKDVTLRNYDRIIIPQRTRTVYVFGQVVTPGHVAFNEGQSYRYYIDKAGGYTEEARSGDVMIIKGSTRVWLDPSETDIQDGDFVWVPKDIHYPAGQYLATIAQIAGIAAGLATIILVIRNL